MNKLLLLLLILLVVIIIPSFFNISTFFKEGFETYNLATTQGEYPAITDTRMLSFYPSTGRLGISNNEAQDIWWHYPIFRVGSYKQITNNIKYPNNPDDGTCMPASMCGALYKEKQIYSNYSEPLPPAAENCAGTRVNYYYTEPNMLAYRTEGNVLY